MFGKIPQTLQKVRGYILHNLIGPLRYMKALMNVCSSWSIDLNERCC